MKDLERDNFWLDLGPKAEYNGMPCADTAAENGDASPDGKLRGFDGAENGCGCGRPEDDRRKEDPEGCGYGRPARNGVTAEQEPGGRLVRENGTACRTQADALLRAHENAPRPQTAPVPEPWEDLVPPPEFPMIPPDGSPGL